MNIYDVHDNITGVYWGALRDVLQYGQDSSPRGMRTKEIVGARLTMLNPDKNIINMPGRKLNFAFSVAEWAWIQFGYDEAKYIVPFNKQLAKFSDDGETFAGAYGPKVHDQWDYALRSMRQDPDSRQAIINIWRERQGLGPSKDVPCTLSWQFLLRQGRLNMISTMRSNDAWLGLPYDLFNFTQVQRMMAFQLGVPVGTYVHQVGSLHLYEEHFDKAKALVEATRDWTNYRSPALSPMPVSFFLNMFDNLATQGPLMSPAQLTEWAMLVSKELSSPWKEYFLVMASKWNPELLPEPWKSCSIPK